MVEAHTRSPLLLLPWEIRRPIIIEVLRYGRKFKPPSFSRELIESRVRLCNHFDDNYPDRTNFYVPRHKSPFLHGHGLRAANRQLCHETKLLIKEELESGNTEIPFILDVMFVKDIGIFPTWTSFPYQPEHLKMLTINLRIIRPGTAIVPDEWIEVARYRESDLSRRHAYPDQWNLMAILLYAFGCFSVKPGPSRLGAQRKSQPAIASEAAPSQQQAANRGKYVQLPAGPKPKMPKFRKRPNLAHHHSDVVNAYCLSSGSYVTDELFLDIKEREYDVNNKPIPIGDDDSPKKSRFYKEGCLQFGRDIFRDYSYKWKDMEEIQMEESFISQGKYACYQLEEYFCEELCAVAAPERSLFTTHVRMLAHSVGKLRYSACQRRSHLLLTRHPFEWTEIGLDVHRDYAKYSEANIERNLAMVMAYATLDDEDERTISGLRTLKIRRTHGWVRDDD